DFVRDYGWRAYALPILALITILALFTATSHGKTTGRTAAGQQSQHGNTGGAPPVASPSISLKSDTPGADSRDTALKSAALPPGAKYTVTGKGTYTVLKGTSKVVGGGHLYRYTIDVENGITGVDLKQYATLVQTTLSDARSWSGHGVSLQRVDSGPA